jgi:hypothetical protein
MNVMVVLRIAPRDAIERGRAEVARAAAALAARDARVWRAC